MGVVEVQISVDFGLADTTISSPHRRPPSPPLLNSTQTLAHPFPPQPAGRAPDPIRVVISASKYPLPSLL